MHFLYHIPTLASTRPRTPLSKLRYKFEKLTEHDKKYQVKAIKDSFAQLTATLEKDMTGVKMVSPVESVAEISYKSNDYVDTAKKIGYKLVEDRVTSENGCTWVSPFVSPTSNQMGRVIMPVGDDLYMGNSGIALFLMYLGHTTGINEFTDTAKEAMISPIRMLTDRKDEMRKTGIGLYTGYSGMLFALHKLSLFDGSKTYKQEILQGLRTIINGIPEDQHFDMISGSAGVMACVEVIERESDDSEIIRYAQLAAEAAFNHLLANASTIKDSGTTWVRANGEYCVGFAHGNAGIQKMLSRYATSHKLKSRKIRSIILGSEAFIQGCYSDELGNWYKSDKDENFSFGWCNGSAGMLAHYFALPEGCISTDVQNNYAKKALNSVCQYGFGNNPTLCHGDLGNLDIVKQYAIQNHDTQLESRCDATFQKVYENIIVPRWHNASYLGMDCAAMMLGATGFGYSLLRRVNRSNVPSVLFIE